MLRKEKKIVQKAYNLIFRGLVAAAWARAHAAGCRLAELGRIRQNSTEFDRASRIWQNLLDLI